MIEGTDLRTCICHIFSHRSKKPTLIIKSILQCKLVNKTLRFGDMQDPESTGSKTPLVVADIDFNTIFLAI
jgi:hypothetical protein